MNEAKTDVDLFNFIKDNRKYQYEWCLQKQGNHSIQEILNKSSKKKTGEKGYPDLIYVNEGEKLLILVENKSDLKHHVSTTEDKAEQYAVDGIKHYLAFFKESEISKEKDTTQNFFKDWKIVGIAFSGDINSEYNQSLSTFVVDRDLITDIKEKEVLDEDDYLAFFENIDLEKIADSISKYSLNINNILRNLDSQKRPVLLSSLMICLYPNDKTTSFSSDFISWEAKTIIHNIPHTIKEILSNQNIDGDKIDILINELSFIKTDNDLNTTDILKDILIELKNHVIPLFKTKSSYDIIGKFYEEFLRYAGIANVKRGIVLTPNHITDMFTDLIDIKVNDVIFDPACGTGAFLIAAMNKLTGIIKNSTLQDKRKRLEDVKRNQLIGFEKSSTMYSLSISNMLFRGDGKSQIFNEDFFASSATSILSKLPLKPTIGFINPPFGGGDKKENPTKKEIQFLQKMLDQCSRYGVIIAPLSIYFKDDLVRRNILSKHRLKYVINMPNDLFQPNASTHTAIAVFETNKAHSFVNDKVVFCDLKDDGLILSKNKGRTDALNKWNSIKKDIMEKINDPAKHEDNISLVYKTINANDEWIIQAHSKTHRPELDEIQSQIKGTIIEYAIFKAKKKLDVLSKKLTDIELLGIFNSRHLNIGPLQKMNIKLKDRKYKEYDLADFFNVKGSRNSYTKKEIFDGEFLYVTTSNKNNGVVATANIWTENENVITIDSATDGASFYQEFRFVGSDHVEVLKPKPDFDLDKYIGMFLVSILNQQLDKYSFGRKRSQKRICKENVFLPIGKEGNPDWEFIRDYVKSLPYSSNL